MMLVLAVRVKDRIVCVRVRCVYIKEATLNWTKIFINFIAGLLSNIYMKCVVPKITNNFETSTWLYRESVHPKEEFCVAQEAAYQQ